VPFLVLEYVFGVDLWELGRWLGHNSRQLGVPLAVYIATEILAGVEAVHQVRDAEGNPLLAVHRDVSPPNILISWSGEVKITDFGLAKAVSQLERTEPGIVKGKFSYLSPEAAEAKTVDARSDIFSAGIILHEFLTLRRLFMGNTDNETVELVKKCQIPAPSSINEQVSTELDEIVFKALTKDRKKRYQSAYSNMITEQGPNRILAEDYRRLE